MKKLILGIIIGISIGGLVCTAKDVIAVNPVEGINSQVSTTKVTTADGTYRIFIYRGYGSVSAVKIK